MLRLEGPNSPGWRMRGALLEGLCIAPLGLKGTGLKMRTAVGLGTRRLVE